MGRLGITIPLETVPLAEQREWMAGIADLGFDDVWSFEGHDLDGFTPLVLASQWAPTLRLGCALFPVQTRGPALLAQSLAALCSAAPGRVVAGLGCSSPIIVSDWNGIPFEKPYQYTRDTALFLREVLAGKRVHHDYESFSVRGFGLHRGPPEPPPKLLLGALRPGMLELSSRVADGVILNWLTPEDLATVLPHVRKHAPDGEVALRIIATPSEDSEKVRALARVWLAPYFNVPTYKAQQQWLGREGELASLWERWEAGDPKGAMAALSDETVDAFYLHGPPERLHEAFERYFEAGVDTLIVGVLEQAMDPREATRRLGRDRG
ncbi:MAG: LLM class F420-dependent oxidoreductase [Myxococcota bacterium]